MALSTQERKELLKLYAKCIDPKDGEQPLPDADKKDLARLQILLDRMTPEPQDQIGAAQPVKLKDYTQSPLLKQKIAGGAVFQGVEMRNHGTEEKPVMVVREWLYVGEGNERKAAFIQYQVGHAGDGLFIEAGRTIAASAYARFGK
jgi:hypothetical protein